MNLDAYDFCIRGKTVLKPVFAFRLRIVLMATTPFWVKVHANPVQVVSGMYVVAPRISFYLQKT